MYVGILYVWKNFCIQWYSVVADKLDFNPRTHYTIVKNRIFLVTFPLGIAWFYFQNHDFIPRYTIVETDL